MRALGAAPLIALGLGSGAQGAEWRVVPERSQIGFEYLIDGTPREGVFERVAGEGNLDPSDPAEARLELRIAAESIDLGQRLVNAYATSAEWFDAANHPDVTYRLVALEPVDPPEYRALGEVALKGRTVLVETPVRLQIEAGTARAEGRIELSRGDFGLGVGLSELFVEVGDRVVVAFDVTALRADAAGETTITGQGED